MNFGQNGNCFFLCVSNYLKDKLKIEDISHLKIRINLINEFKKILEFTNLIFQFKK